MGYYTSYWCYMYENEGQKLNCTRDASLEDQRAAAVEIAKRFFEEDEDGGDVVYYKGRFEKSDDPIAELLADDVYKWYDHENDMIEVSKLFPNHAFVLYGDGEDKDDRWKEIFLNGHAAFCQGRVVYDAPRNGWLEKEWDPWNGDA